MRINTEINNKCLKESLEILVHKGECASNDPTWNKYQSSVSLCVSYAEAGN